MMRKVVYGLTVLLTVAVVVVELLLGAPVIPVFALSSLALVGLAWVLGQATESLGHHAGPRIGGILNATFGNAAELIITIFALAAGLTTVVKASIIGSVIGNVLLVLGASFLIGGLKNGTQRFSATLAGANASMLAIVAAALSIPTIFATTGSTKGFWPTEYLSIEVAVVMLVLYILYLIFYFRHPEGTFTGAEEEEVPFGLVASLALLLGTTVAVAYVSEAFVGAIEPLVEETGISELFVGVILVPLVGNVAEHVVGVQIAYKNRMDFSMAVSLGSSLQVALLVTPILVFLGPLLGHPLDLVFSPLELSALGAAVIVTAFISLDGESNWLEGAMLCGVYVIAALAFFFSP
jgi:Ca2+:H+ antiporter